MISICYHVYLTTLLLFFSVSIPLQEFKMMHQRPFTLGESLRPFLAVGGSFRLCRDDSTTDISCNVSTGDVLDSTNVVTHSTATDRSQCVELEKADDSIIVVELSLNDVFQDAVAEEIVTPLCSEVSEENFDSETDANDTSSPIADYITLPIVAKNDEGYKGASLDMEGNTASEILHLDETSVTEGSFIESSVDDEGSETEQFKSAIEEIVVSTEVDHTNEFELTDSSSKLFNDEFCSTAFIDGVMESELIDVKTKSSTSNLLSLPKIEKKDSEPSDLVAKIVADESSTHLKEDKVISEFADRLPQLPSSDSTQFADEEVKDSQLDDSASVVDTDDVQKSKAESSINDLPISTVVESELLKQSSDKFSVLSKFKHDSVSELTINSTESSHKVVDVATKLDTSECFPEQIKSSSVETELTTNCVPSLLPKPAEIEIQPTEYNIPSDSGVINVKLASKSTIQFPNDAPHISVKFRPSIMALETATDDDELAPLLKEDAEMSEEFASSKAFDVSDSEGVNFIDDEGTDLKNVSMEAVVGDTSFSAIETSVACQWFDMIVANVDSEFQSVSKSFLEDSDLEESVLSSCYELDSDEAISDKYPLASSCDTTKFDATVPKNGASPYQASASFCVITSEDNVADKVKSPTVESPMPAEDVVMLLADEENVQDDVSAVTLPDPVDNILYVDKPLTVESALTVEVAASLSDLGTVAQEYDDGAVARVSDMVVPQDDDQESQISSGGAEVARALAHMRAFEDDDNFTSSPPLVWDRLEPPRNLMNGGCHSRSVTSPKKLEFQQQRRPSSTDEPDDNSSVYFDSCAEPRSAPLSDDEVPPKSFTSSASDDASVASSVEAADASADTTAEAAAADLWLVSYANSPGNFFVQRVADAEALRNMEEQLGKFQKGGELPLEAEAVEEKTLYGAEIDGRLYRVRVLTEDGAIGGGVDDANGGYTVCCVDYGRVCKVLKLFGLPQSVRRVEPLAKACAIPLPYYLRTWPVNVCHEFDRLVLANQPKFTLRIRETCDAVAIVDLVRGGRSIAQRMKTLCEEFNTTGDTLIDSPDKLSDTVE